MDKQTAIGDLWIVETYSQVHYFKSKIGADLCHEKYGSRWDTAPYQASESQKCWHYTRHANCGHLK